MMYLIDPSEVVQQNECKKYCKGVYWPLYGIDPVPL